MKDFASAVSGRLRIRFPALANPLFAAHVADALNKDLPITATRHNPAACSLIIEYDAKRLPLADAVLRTKAHLASCQRGIEGAAMPRRRRRSARLRLNRYAKIAALASLSISLASAYTGPKRLHIITGWIFVACLCAHLAIFRRTLIH